MKELIEELKRLNRNTEAQAEFLKQLGVNKNPREAFNYGAPVGNNPLALGTYPKFDSKIINTAISVDEDKPTASTSINVRKIVAIS